MDNGSAIENLIKEVSGFRGDFNDHKGDDQEWKANHEKADHLAFDDLKTGLQGLYTAQRDLVREMKGLRADLQAISWITDGSKGFSMIPKSIYIIIVLTLALAFFGFKSTLAYIIGFIK